MNTKHQCNQLTKKNSRRCRSVEIFFAAQRNGNLRKPRRTHNRAVRSQNDNCYSLFGPPKKQGQNLFDLKQDRGVAKRTDCVRNQAVEQLWKNTTTQEDDTATRQFYSWRRKTRYKLDEEAPLTTPVDVSVLRYYRFARESSGFVRLERTTGNRKFFFRKREKAKAFSFSIKRNLSLS